MNTRWTTLTRGWLVAAAIGCGSSEPTSDDEAASETAVAAPASAASASRPRENVSKDECIVQTLGVFSQRPDAYSEDCVSCICDQNPTTVALCDDQAKICWGLVTCVAANCAGMEGLDQANCALNMCGEFIEGSGLAMSIGVLLQGDACSAKCPQKR